MQNRNSFQTVTAGSLIGLLSIVLLTTSKATSDYIIWTQTEQAKSQLQANSGLEEQRAKSSKDVADAYQQNQVALFEQLIISNYTLSKNPPRLNWSRTVDPSKKTIVFDQHRRCIGYAQNSKFYFINYYQGVCNNG